MDYALQLLYEVKHLYLMPPGTWIDKFCWVLSADTLQTMGT